ncbi:MAG: DUF3095 family protein [Planctomycetota bacterium]
MTTDLSFYQAIKPFSDFNALTTDEPYHRIPDDWHVVITDVEGSTRAIGEGRYKDVNTLGAACIVAAQNAMGREEFPYVFGGDGATLVIPPSRLAPVGSALRAVATLAATRFGMTLRLGSVAMRRLREEGHDLDVARYTLAGQKTLSLFRGGALARAEELIKGDPTSHTLVGMEVPGDLSGLSCRWQPIRSERGTILSLMVTALGRPNSTIYAEVLEGLNRILEGDALHANPVGWKHMSYKSLGDNFRDEWRYTKGVLSLAFLWRCIEILGAVMVFRWRIPPLVFNPSHYAEAMPAHTDFRKFDDTLRMVVDVTPLQVSRIRDLLADLHDKGRIRYGLHESSTALMTCFVYGLGSGEHIHFIDGGDGGYAMAARQLKSQVQGTGG